MKKSTPHSKVITDLGWIDENGNVNTKKPR